MPSATALYNSGRWLNAADLVTNPNIGLNKRVTALIHHVEEVQVGMGADQKTQLNVSLVSRQGQAWPKTLLLNKGNTMQLVATYGDDYSQWAGKAIDIWAENVMYQGKLVHGIKVQANNSSNGIGAAPATATATATAPASPPPSATAVAGIPAAAAPTWNTVPGGRTTSIDDDEIPF